MKNNMLKDINEVTDKIIVTWNQLKDIIDKMSFGYSLQVLNTIQNNEWYIQGYKEAWLPKILNGVLPSPLPYNALNIQELDWINKGYEDKYNSLSNEYYELSKLFNNFIVSDLKK